MKDLPPLTPRLRAVASLVREGVNVADIGTDHAYLAVWLVRSGGCGRCIACDVNAGPLERARETLRAYGAQDRVELRLADGLDAVRAQEADDVVIAGMGGELIAEIIARCGWLRESSKHLVLQPMTAQPELRRALCRSGFEIVREGAAREGAKLYVVISAVFTGRVSEPDELFAIAGRLPENTGPEARDYLLWQAAVLRRQAAGMRKTLRLLEQAEQAELLAQRLEALTYHTNSN